MLQIHTYLPPSRPISVSKIGSHAPPLCRSLGFGNVQDDVDRPFLYNWAGASDSDQACYAGFFGRRSRAGSKQDRAGSCSERVGEGRQAKAARHSCKDPDCCAGYEGDACGKYIHQLRDHQSIGKPQAHQGDRERTLAGRQCYSHVGRIYSSGCQEPRIKEKRGTKSSESQGRGLALPTGRRGKSFKVIGPLAPMRSRRRGPPINTRHLSIDAKSEASRTS
jgi:hypothetical protein